MIPTRLNQKLHNGSVVGFSSGSVIVAYESVYYTHLLDFSKLDTINNYYGFASSVQYKLPSVNECAVAVEFLFKNQVTPVIGITSNHDRIKVRVDSFFNTNSIEVINKNTKFIKQIQLDTSDRGYKTYKVSMFSDAMSSGFTIPVFRINGENCDSY